MTDRYFLHDGAYHVLPEGRSLPSGAVEVPRLPGAGETWNAALAQFERDGEVAADLKVTRGHIDLAHVIKTVEASMILSGFALTHGLIAEEAEVTGSTVQSIAAQVAANSAPMRNAERARREEKHHARRR